MTKLARRTLAARNRNFARQCSEILDESGSENEFRLKCAALNIDPDKLFRSYIDFIWLTTGVSEFNFVRKPGLSEWWAWERIPGAVKPDPWCGDRIDADSW